MGDSFHRGSKIGHNHDELAREYQANLNHHLSATDYPVLFHLDRILSGSGERSTVLDFGGNIGVHYLRLKKHLNLEKVKWIVCDVPAIARAGRETCKGVRNIDFIDDLTKFESRDLDVFLASGSIQYVEPDAFLFLHLSSRRPRRWHVLIAPAS